MTIALALLGVLYLIIAVKAVRSAKEYLPEQDVWRWGLIGALTPPIMLCMGLSKLGYWWARSFHYLEDRLFEVMIHDTPKLSPPSEPIIHTNETLQ